ncbi:MAG: SusC/RagA family TonB-linked outer membrane protein [Ginsengibacter sp.]
MTLIRQALLLLIGSFFCLSSFAQSKTITGKVLTSEENTPLAGVTVNVKGTNHSTITDASGNFSIDAQKGATLVFSYVGYETQEEKVGTGNSISVLLNRNSNSKLQDIVVVGYGTQKKANLTGAVTTVDVKKTFESKPLTDPTKALQGVVPGLTITYGNGGLTSSPNITLRGIGSVNGSKAPLILVDNVPTPDLSVIDPNDIESISVLKDAASASIYGARAAFGVVLIKTKTGHFNRKPKITYSDNFSWNTPTVLPDFADPVKSLTGVVAGAARAGNNSPELFGIDLKKEIAGIKNWEENYANNRTGNEMVPGEDFVLGDASNQTYFYRVWDVKDIMLNKWSPQQTHNLQITGGSDNVNYYISSGYSDQTGIMKLNPDKVKKYNVTAALDVKATDWLKVSAKMLYRNFEYDYPYSYEPYFYYMWRWGAWFPYGTYQGKYFRQPPAYLTGANTNTTTDNYSRVDLGATITPIKHVTVQANYTINRDNALGHIKGGPISAWNFWAGGTLPYQVITSSSTNRAEYTTNRTLINSFNGTIKYENIFNNAHHVTLMTGMNAEDDEYQGFYGEQLGLLDPSKPELNLAIGQQYAGSNHSNAAYAGFFGRANYDYKGKYLLELNGRYDGSSTYSPFDRWAFFSSASAGYRISDEKFMDFIKPVVSDLKFRGSIGAIGNLDIGGQFFIPSMNSYNANWIVDGVTVPTFTNPMAIAQSLKWEKIKTTDFGVDASFLHNHITATFDWYQRNTTGMVNTNIVPATFGAAAPHTNQGNLRDRGFELSLSGNANITKNWNFYATVSLDNSNTIVTKWKNDSKYIGQYYDGAEYGAIWGFETAGYFKDAEDVAKSPSQTALEKGNFTYGPGDVKFKDLNGDGKIDAGKSTATDHGDLTIIGNTQPKYLYSARIGSSWKNFDIDVFFQGVGKRAMWGLGDMVIPMYSGAQILYANQVDYWTPDNPNAKYPNPYAGNSSGTVSGISAGGNNFYPQSKYLLNLAYCRLKNITIGYTLPANLMNKLHVNRLRIYVSGENLATISNVGAPLDPEITDGEYGYTGRTYPFEKNYSFGAQLTF